MPKPTKEKTDNQPKPLQAASPDVRTTPTQTKRHTILALLARTDGASLDEMVAATGWLPHTTRAMLTGLKKKGHVLTSDKVDGVRRYRVGAGVS